MTQPLPTSAGGPAGEPSPGESSEGAPDRASRILLLASVFAVAACGLVYELVAGAVSSYLMGDAVTQFSLVIGVFLCAMGFGSYLAKLVRVRLLETFVEVEIWIGLIGGVSSMAMLAINAFTPSLFGALFYGLCATIGALVGLEIPILVRILRREESVSEAISHVLALDYLGALAGAILFPLVALPFLGLSRASVVFGIVNLAVAAAGISLIRGPRLGMIVRATAVGAMLLVAFFASGRLVGFLEDLLYQDEVVYARDTSYQRIVLTRWRDDVRLFLNGHIQFSSVDEARYHETLVHPAMAAAPAPRNVLILGGGDGLAAREVLKHHGVASVTVVDIDPVMTDLAATRPELVALNRGSLTSPRVHVVNTDAMEFLRADRGFYEVVVSDLPDPSTPALAKLYSRAFYASVARRLSENGVMVTQATSPFFAREAFWCIATTIEHAVADDELDPLIALPYHAHVPSFGEWGFVLAARHRIAPDHLAVGVPTRYLTDDVLHALFAFGADVEQLPVEVNRLDDPILHRYYARGWDRYNE